MQEFRELLQGGPYQGYKLNLSSPGTLTFTLTKKSIWGYTTYTGFYNHENIWVPLNETPKYS